MVQGTVLVKLHELAVCVTPDLDNLSIHFKHFLAWLHLVRMRFVDATLGPHLRCLLRGPRCPSPPSRRPSREDGDRGESSDHFFIDGFSGRFLLGLRFIPTSPRRPDLNTPFRHEPRVKGRESTLWGGEESEGEDLHSRTYVLRPNRPNLRTQVMIHLFN